MSLQQARSGCLTAASLQHPADPPQLARPAERFSAQLSQLCSSGGEAGQAGDVLNRFQASAGMLSEPPSLELTYSVVSTPISHPHAQPRQHPGLSWDLTGQLKASTSYSQMLHVPREMPLQLAPQPNPSAAAAGQLQGLDFGEAHPAVSSSGMCPPTSHRQHGSPGMAALWDGRQEVLLAAAVPEADSCCIGPLADVHGHSRDLDLVISGLSQGPQTLQPDASLQQQHIHSPPSSPLHGQQQQAPASHVPVDRAPTSHQPLLPDDLPAIVCDQHFWTPSSPSLGPSWPQNTNFSCTPSPPPAEAGRSSAGAGVPSGPALDAQHGER